MEIIKRNVAKVGDRLMVALDKNWCRENNIKKGTELDVIMVPNGFCVLAPEKGKR